MNRPLSVWIPTASTFLTFGVLGMSVPGVVGIQGTAQRWIVTGVLWFLGLIASVLVFLWRRAKDKTAPPPEKSTDEIDVTIAAARNRLAAARGKAAARFGQLPVILIAGPPGTAKTTLITRSGMEPELLAGEVVRGDAVIPTSAVNVWFAQGNLVFEAGGPVAADETKWRRLIRHLQPSRAGAVFSKGAQAPRVAVVCFGCDELIKPGASEAVAAMAQALRSRLADVSQQIGIRLPVYVIFTKADRLPHFDDFVRNLTRDEARDVLGATLPIASAGNVGQYAERESQRLAHAFYEVFRGLSIRRLDVLTRETQDSVRAGVYEFPREFRKVTDLATQFLLDLCRPSQLGVSPFLRGFYFTGVRAIYVHDAAAPAPALQQRSPSGTPDATGVFDPRMLPGAAPVMQQPTAGSRKVPEWVGLDRVFKDLILKDRVAQGVTAGGTKVTLGRRLVLGAVVAALLVFSLGMTVSLFSNLRLLGRTRASVEDARALARVSALPDLDALQRLDRLRVQSARLNDYARNGHPLRLNWLLYAGDRIQPEVRDVYFQKFSELLWEPTRTTLNSWLAALPPQPAPNSDYDSAFEGLKAYLVTTEFADSAKRDFLAPALMQFWSMNAQVDAERRALADSQFAFFADELPEGNPYDHKADPALVQRTRAFMAAFAGDAQLYSYLLSVAGDSLAPIQWPGGPVRNDFVVPAAFTAAGWTKAQAALGNVDKLFNRETWVVGEGAVAAQDRQRLERALRERYTEEYINAWINYLKAGGVGAFAGVPDAASKLAALATPSSPLLRMIGVASDNTAGLDSVSVGRAFKPAHTVAAPKATTPTEAGGKYVNSLTSFQAAIQLVATSGSGPVRDQAQAQANLAATQAKGVVSEISQGFELQGHAQAVGAAIRTLLQQPLTAAEAALGRVSVDELNSKGGSFCRPFQQLAGKFPFSPRSQIEAPLDEVANLLAPNTGAYATFYQDNLQGLLSKVGNRYETRAGANPPPNPGFRAYFNNLEDVSNALFPPGTNVPQVDFTLRMNATAAVPEIVVTMGRRVSYTPTQLSNAPFQWSGAATGARIIGRVNNQEVPYADVPPGPWSVFRLFYGADLEPQSATTYAVTWRVEGRPPITGLLTFPANKPHPVFTPGWLGRVGNCVSRIAQ